MWVWELGNSNNDGWAVVNKSNTTEYLNVTEAWKEGREKRPEHAVGTWDTAASESSRGKPGTDPKAGRGGGGLVGGGYFAAGGVDSGYR